MTSTGPLAELSPMECRQNSTSLQPAPNATAAAAAVFAGDTPSGTSSKHRYWQARDPNSADVENSPERQLSPKRSSIENLMKASRVRNSTMFAREQKNEYDPTKLPLVERPLATSRPPATASPKFVPRGFDPLRSRVPNVTAPSSHHPRPRQDGSSADTTPSGSPSKFDGGYAINPAPPAPAPHSPPFRSSLSRPGRVSPRCDEPTAVDSDKPLRPLRRHAKSVTFESNPPVVNEYEMVTPEPSLASQGSSDDEDEQDYAFEDDSLHREDSFDESLEDARKTPVVLPDDWHHAGTHVADAEPACTADDVSLPGSARSPAPPAARPSDLSYHEQRPLPPLPPSSPAAPGHHLSLRKKVAINGLSAFAGDLSTHRSLPSPPSIESPISKPDIHAPYETTPAVNDKEEPPIAPDLESEHEDSEDATDFGYAVDELELNETVPHISRESILENINIRRHDDDVFDDSKDNVVDVSPVASGHVSIDFGNIPQLSIAHCAAAPTDTSDDGDDDDDDDYDHNSFSETCSVIRHDISGIGDDGDDYFEEEEEEEEGEEEVVVVEKEDGTGGQYATDEAHGQPIPQIDLDLSFSERPRTPDRMLDESDMSVTGPDRRLSDSTPRTHRPLDLSGRESSSEVEEPVATIKAPGGSLKTRTSATPSDFATMAATRRKVSGEAPPAHPASRLTRLPMPTTAEYEDERSDGSTLSDDQPPSTDDETRSEGREPRRPQNYNPHIDVPIGDDGDLGLDVNIEMERINNNRKKGYLMRQNTKIVVASSRNLSGDHTAAALHAALGAPVTGERGAVPAPGSGSAASKKDRDPSKTWTTEPWNSKPRRGSTRNTSNASVARRESRSRTSGGGTAPLSPGQEFAGNDMALIDENDENLERGRLFVKVVGVNGLDLPIPSIERTQFNLTLDNGLHCVTTTWFDLARDAPIGQEFELVVLNDLEFQLTLQTRPLTPPPKPQVAAPPLPAHDTKSKRHKKSNSATSILQLFTSPRKRQNEERRRREHDEMELNKLRKAEQDAAARRAKTNPTAWDLLHELVATDGSFARAFVCLKNHEREAYGRLCTVDVPLFNEWALEDAEIASSVKSKRGGPVHRPPYKIGQLTLQLLYVPKPKGATDDDLPKSMNACIREIDEAKQAKPIEFEGYLSQQGGDCQVNWRHRYFKLSGTKLTACHHTTRQPRSTIDLAKATELIDGQHNTSHSVDGSPSKRALADEDEAYAFVEGGFRIRFKNGEVIDFYASNNEQKAEWLRILSTVVGKGVASTSAPRAWIQMVFKKEAAERAAEEQSAAIRGQEKHQTHAADITSSTQYAAQSISGPTRPAMYDRQVASNNATSDKRALHRSWNVHPPPPPMEQSARSQHVATTPRTSARRGEVRSMIF